jgi:hypothetical protein
LGSLSSITRHAATVHFSRIQRGHRGVTARAVTVVPAGVAGGPGAEGGALAAGLSWRSGREEKARKFAKMIVTRAISKAAVHLMSGSSNWRQLLMPCYGRVITTKVDRPMRRKSHY